MQSCTHLYVHCVWATRQREPYLTEEVREVVYAVIAEQCRKHEAQPLAIGGVEDHVHLLVRLPATVTVAEVMRSLKGAFSHLFNQLKPDSTFRWQSAYGAFSVSPQDVLKVTTYIQNQVAHHADKTLNRDWERMSE